jgi:hypothetical protein
MAIKINTKDLMNTDAFRTVSGPAWIAIISYLVLGAVILFPFKYTYLDPQTNKYVDVEYDFGARLVALLIMAFPIALSVYSINCMVIGKCNLYSLFVAILTAAWVVLFVISAFAFTFFNKRMPLV